MAVVDISNKYISSKKEIYPQIYAYYDDRFPGLLKIGYTERKDVFQRIKEQSVSVPHNSIHLVWTAPAMRNDGTTFTDKELHKVLRNSSFKQIKQDETNQYTEFFKCELDDVKKCYLAVKERQSVALDRTEDFKMRDEQKEAVDKTYDYFVGRIAANEVPHFLWNCKMRFGKTFASYQLMKKMNAKKVLILTFKPAVETQWKEDLLTHVDFEEYQFTSKATDVFEDIDENKPFVCFGSLQDYLGKSASGGIKVTNQKVFDTKWDLIILDEYHYGAWNDRTQKVVDTKDLSQLEKDNIKELQELEKESGYNDLASEWDESTLKSSAYLYLSGTPFRALATGMFMEDQIYNWTYADEQNRKKEYIDKQIKNNPYLELPEMVFMTYQMPNSVTDIIDNYGQDEFSLSEFFKATGRGTEARFVHEESVQKFLDILRNKISIKDVEDPNATIPPLPYNNVELQNICNHQMWLLPNISSCDAMENLLKMSQNDIYNKKTIINASGAHAGIGQKALEPVLRGMGDNPYSENSVGTITLTCGKLTTGVTIRPLTSIFMLSNCNAPETYFQTAFRVQSPWTTKNDNNEKVILKDRCYVFDFAPNRALSLVVDYACKLDPSSRSAIDKVEDFINFLPVLQYDGCTMKPVSAREIVEFVDNGTTSTLLARRWQSNDLFDISNTVLERILGDADAMRAIEAIEGWRKDVGTDAIEALINRTKKIKELKKKGDDITKKEKKQLSEEERERNSTRKRILEKLKQFIRRIPVFMYLSEYREECLNDVITKLEPELFKQTTGLSVQDFDTLKKAGLFSTDKLDLAVLYFKRYEDASLTYSGVDKHSDDRNVGLFNTVISKEEYQAFGLTPGRVKFFYKGW